MKKAQVEIQFNWIFVLIVGAILLAFFVTIAMKQSSTAETIVSAGRFDSLNGILASVTSPEGSTTLPVWISTELNYDCIRGEPCACDIYSGKKSSPTARLSTEDLFIFSPERLKGNYKIVSSTEWTFPFRVANFIFITSPEIKYMIEDTFEGEVIYDSMPPETILEDEEEYRAIDKDLFSLDDIEITQGNYKVRFVFTETNPTEFNIPEEIANMPNEDVSAVYFTKENDADVVNFYIKNNDEPPTFTKKDSSFILGDATKYAAIFSENKDNYACMMNNVMKRFKAIAEINKRKQDIYSEYMDCKIQSSSGKSSDMNSCCISYNPPTSSDLVGTDIDFLNPSFDFSSLKSSVNLLTAQNDDAVGNGCPNLF